MTRKEFERLTSDYDVDINCFEIDDNRICCNDCQDHITGIRHKLGLSEFVVYLCEDCYEELKKEYGV